jgi:hypothetical protein
MHTMRQSYRSPSFSVQQPFVVISWNFPLPNQACSGARANGLLVRLRALMSQKAPLAEFTCKRMLLHLSGEAQTGTTGATTGKLTYSAAVILKRI